MSSLHPHPFAVASFNAIYRCCFQNHSGGTNVPFVADAVLRLSKRCGCLHRHLGLVRTSWALTAIFTLVAELPFFCYRLASLFARAGPEQALAGLRPRCLRPCAGHLCPLCLALCWPNCVLCYRPCAGLTAWFPGPEQAWRYLDFGPEQAVLLRAVLALCWPLVHFLIKIGHSTSNSTTW